MNLKETFNKELLPQLQETLGIDNIMAVPKLTKVVINMGVGEALTDKKHLESAVNDLELIAGQKAVITKAKKGSLHDRRQVLKMIQNKAIVAKLFEEIGPKYEDRNGGYTRITRTTHRQGDGTELAVLELV